MASRKNAIYILLGGVKVAYRIHAPMIWVRLPTEQPALKRPRPPIGDPKLYYEMDLGWRKNLPFLYI